MSANSELSLKLNEVKNVMPLKKKLILVLLDMVEEIWKTVRNMNFANEALFGLQIIQVVPHPPMIINGRNRCTFYISL